MAEYHPPTPPLDPAALELPLDALTPPLDWTALYGRPGPNALEIGTGNGYFLEREAGRLPEFNFLGVEREQEFYEKMVKRCARAGLANVRTTPIDAYDLMQDWIAPRTLTRVYLYFSDPWPKRRHADRRVFGERFLPLLEPRLVPGGELWFKTDVGWYFNLAVTTLRRRGGWEIREIGKLPPPDPARGEVYSNYERKARAQGIEVWGFKARPLISAIQG